MSDRKRDALGTRMKEQYEQRARLMLPRRSWTCLRLDGRSFHQYTRGLDRPFDQRLMDDMAETALFLCREVAGVALAYTQSDEISLILTDFATPKTEAWFDGNQQKMVSISAALATAKFNELRPGKIAVFDSRAFTIPDPVEVGNYLIWREQDCTRNSISMAAHAHFSHRQLHGKSGNEMQEMLWRERGINWNDYPDRFKRGTVITQHVERSWVSYVDKRTGETCTTDEVERKVWRISAPPIFTQAPEFFAVTIPGYARLQGRSA